MGKEERELLTDILEELRFVSRTLMYHFPTPPPAREPTPVDWDTPVGTIPLSRERRPAGAGSSVSFSSSGVYSMAANSTQIVTFTRLEPPDEGTSGVLAYTNGGGGGAGSPGVSIEIDGITPEEAMDAVSSAISATRIKLGDTA